MKEFVTAFEEVAKEDDGTPIEEQYIAFTLDGRELRSYPLTDGQVTFMMAGLGRGQTDSSRFAVMLNVIMESLRDEDKDYLESRMLTSDPKQRIGITTLEQIFEYLTSEWFGRPTQSPSDSV